MRIKDYRKYHKNKDSEYPLFYHLMDNLKEKGWECSHETPPDPQIFGETFHDQKRIYINANISNKSALFLLTMMHEMVHAEGISGHGPKFYEALGRIVTSYGPAFHSFIDKKYKMFDYSK